MACPAEIKERLSLLREELAAGPQVQNWLSTWWAGLLPNDRRLLLAMAGLDDGEDVARRRLEQFRPTDRAVLVNECKRMLRLCDPVRWA